MVVCCPDNMPLHRNDDPKSSRLGPNRQWDAIWRMHPYSVRRSRMDKAMYKLQVAKEHLGIVLPPRPRILDLGCGTGELAQAMLEGWPDATLLGVDGSIAAISRSPVFGKNPQARAIVHDLNEPLVLEEKFHLVLAVGVLEHMVAWDTLVFSICAHLHPGGRVLLVHSNAWSPFALERRVRQMCGNWPYGYQKEVTRRKLCSILDKAGLLVNSWIFPCNEGRVVSKLDRFWYALTRQGRYVAVLAERRP